MAVIKRRIISMCSAILFNLLRKFRWRSYLAVQGFYSGGLKIKARACSFRTTMFDIELRVDGKGGRGGQEKAPPLPSTSFWPSVTPLGKIFFLSSAFRCRKNQRWQLQLCRLWRNHRHHRLWTLQNRFVIHKPVFFHAFLIGKKDFLTVAHYCELDFFKNGIKS